MFILSLNRKGQLCQDKKATFWVHVWCLVYDKKYLAFSDMYMYDPLEIS